MNGNLYMDVGEVRNKVYYYYYYTIDGDTGKNDLLNGMFVGLLRPDCAWRVRPNCALKG